jgi:hypothetical protein
VVDVGDGRDSKETWMMDEGGDIDLNVLANSKEVETAGWVNDDTVLRVFPVGMESDCSGSPQPEILIRSSAGSCMRADCS